MIPTSRSVVSLVVLAAGLGTGVATLPALSATTAPATQHDAAPALPPMSVAQLVERNATARGGAAAWKAINSIRYSGTLDAGRVRPDNGLHSTATERLVEKPNVAAKPGQAKRAPIADADGTPVSLPYSLTMQRPDKQRIEVKFKDQTLVQVWDGTNGWKLQPYLNRGGAIAFSAEELEKARQFQPIEGPLVGARERGTKVELDGTDLVDGKPAYRLKLTLKDGAKRRIWLDAATFLDVQVDGTRHYNGHVVAEYTTLRDFRSVGALKVPFLMETRADGLPTTEKVVIEKVDVNPAVDATQFAKPL